MPNLEKKYNPKDFEEKIYKQWEDGGYFKAGVKSNREAFSIVLPPPNITGKLHMGHALDHTLQDILVRFKRMQGYNTLWQPGTDHASIATEVKVLERLRQETGKTKEEIGREEFLKQAWKWKEEFGNTIVDQMKKLGDSCDWSRERFTMDEGCNEAVKEFFVRLYEDGYIYKDNRIINWCPDCKTSLSDAEVEHEETQGKFYHIKYKLEDSEETIEIATTRPETILGDTAVAVNPKDERYTSYVGKNVVLPVIGKVIPIIADEYVDMEFGTGVVKITPCHDPNDFEVGKRHSLPQVLVIGEDGKMNKNAGKYEGMDRFECRKAIIEDIEKLGQLVKIKDHDHNVGHCYRCHTIVEPMTSKQWFVKMKDLAQKAIEVLKTGELNLIPERFDKTYLNWLENIRDWCISRQLWWGHRIPAYYCQECGEIIVAKEKPDMCPKCKSYDIVQDEDVLDTWFSSALWPLSTLGWPNETRELIKYFPTSTLVTGYDIIFFWVIRMVFSALYITGEVPFKDVFFHGIVRDSQGRKMSKSLGNGIDPLEVIEKYGADALRMTLATGNSPGNDMRFYEERVVASRNFANKIWNSTRFILMNLEENDISDLTYENVKDKMEISDKWIISRMNQVTREVTENMDKYELGLAMDKIYDFAWNTFCDWYIELVKSRLYNPKSEENKKIALFTLKTVLEDILKLLHPFIPFITEEIWSKLDKEDLIIVSSWPVYDPNKNYPKEEKNMDILIDAVTKIRNARAENNIPLSKKAKLLVIAENDDLKEVVNNTSDYFISVGSVSEIEFISQEQIPTESINVIIPGLKLYIPTEDIIDFEKEQQRLEKEQEKLISEIKRVDSKMANEGFMSKAPEKLIEAEKAKKVKFEQMLQSVEKRLEEIKNR